jgi:hypothetical protein
MLVYRTVCVWIILLLKFLDKVLNDLLTVTMFDKFVSGGSPMFVKSSLRLLFLLTILLSLPAVNAFADDSNKGYEFGVSAGVWFAGGDVSVDSDPYYNDFQKDNSFLMKGYLDSIITPKFCIGMYMHYAPSVTYENTYIEQSMIEFGFAIKPRFVLNDTVVLKPGLGIGYRKYYSDSKTADNMQALGTNFSCEIQFVSKKFTPYVEVGFLAQPVGGNSDWSMDFPPIWYLMGGIAF